MSKLESQLLTFGQIAKKVKAKFNRTNNDIHRYIAGNHMNSNRLDIDTWGLIGSEYLGPAFDQIFEPHHILYGSRRTYLRKVSKPEFRGVCANTTFVIEAIPGKLESELLPYLMLSEGFSRHSISKSKGSTNPYINWKDIVDYQFKLPNQEIQVKMVEIFSTIKKQMVSVRMAINYQRLIIMKVRKNLVINDEKTTMRLSDVMKCNYGDSLPAKKRKPGVIPVVSSAGICGHHSQHNVEGAGIVIGRKGNAGTVHWVEKSHFVIDTAFSIECDKKLVDPKYLYHLLSALRLEKYVITTTVPGIGRSDIISERVCIPSFEHQSKSLQILDRLTNQTQILERRLCGLQDLMLSLANKLFG